jgi:hypothetical protein
MGELLKQFDGRGAHVKSEGIHTSLRGRSSASRRSSVCYMHPTHGSSRSGPPPR